MVDYIFHSKLKKKEESQQQQKKPKFSEYVPTSNNKPEITSPLKQWQEFNMDSKTIEQYKNDTDMQYLFL